MKCKACSFNNDFDEIQLKVNQYMKMKLNYKNKYLPTTSSTSSYKNINNLTHSGENFLYDHINHIQTNLFVPIEKREKQRKRQTNL